MKKLILTSFAVTCAAGVFAQGYFDFYNHSTGSYVQHVYAPLATAPSFSQMGFGSNDFNPITLAPGTTSWAGFAPIGAVASGHYSGSGTITQMLYGNGDAASEASLVPMMTAPAIVTFHTGVGAGFVSALNATANNVTAPGTATLEMVAWDASNPIPGYNLAVWGTPGTPGEKDAYDAWQAELIAAGKSQIWTDELGGFGTPPSINPWPQALSFNLYFTIPEPSTLALAGLGAAALLIFRRRKSDG